MAKQIGWSQESNLLYQISALITRLTQVTAAGAGTALPPQAGNIGYYLQTNGSVASWQPLIVDNSGSKLFNFYNFT